MPVREISYNDIKILIYKGIYLNLYFLYLKGAVFRTNSDFVVRRFDRALPFFTLTNKNQLSIVRFKQTFARRFFEQATARAGRCSQ